MVIGIIMMTVTTIFFIMYIIIKKIMEWKVIACLTIIVVALPVLQLFNSGKISDLFLEYGDKKVRLVKSKLEEIKAIELKIKNISETMAELIAINQAWSGARLSELEGVIQRMEEAKIKINSFLDVVDTSPKKRKEILKELEDMIKRDKERLESKKK